MNGAAVPLDHIVWAVPDLAEAAADFAERTGVAPVRGGSHVGLDTANHLVGLGGSAYLELIGPDPDQPAPPRGRPFRIDGLGAARVVTWAVRPDDLDGLVVASRADGYDPGRAASMSRRTADGELLTWRLTPAEFDRSAGLIPFLIDWGDTPHPTTRALPTVSLLAFSAAHPDPDDVQRALSALGVELELRRADVPGLTLVVRGDRGTVTL